MYKITRKISILIFTIWFAVCAVYIYPQRRAEAFVPAILAAPYVAPVVCALVAAGVTFLTIKAAEDIAQWFYSSASDELKTEITNMASQATATSIVASNVVWTGIKEFLRPDIADATKADVAFAMGTLRTIYGNVPVTSTLYNAELHYSDKTWYYYGKGGSYSGNPAYDRMELYKSDGTSPFWWRTGSAAGITVTNYNLKVNISGKIIVQTWWSNGAYFSDDVTTETGTITGSQVERTSIAYDGMGGFLDNPAFDPATEGEERKFGLLGDVSLTTENLINKTYTDVDRTTSTPVDPPANPPADTTFDGTSEITGLLSVFNAIKTMSANIAKFFDLTTPINMEPLKLSGEIFTTRFPFSLPWDLMRSFQLFNDNSFNPVLNVNIPAGPILPNMDFNIDLSVWSNIVGYVKALELLIFDITLVLMTRKLLGGGV